ncbi:zinc-dependent metalloprotease [Rubrobacter xylanophilus]|nr:zinc-dependent metalloprotease [Rubrobacter xylanophilus]
MRDEAMISWGAARTIAVAVAARSETPPASGFDYPAAVEKATDALSGFTGIEPPRSPAGERQLRVADRAEWIDFNIEGFGALMEPVLKRAAQNAGALALAFGGVTLTAQVGLLLGFLSSRVLGQYDTGPLLARERAGRPGKVFFLDGNISAAAARLRVPADGMRLWIVLHEMTHALQFEGYPWLRVHLGSLLERLLAPLAERIGVLETVRRVAENLRTGGRSLELVMSREQREAFDRMQAAMSVVEGYSDYVMHRVGSRMVPGYGHLSRRMAQSRLHRPPLESAIFRMTGMDMKLEQYRLGERFADAVARRQGMEGLNRVWERPENLPSLRELYDPGLWMLRMEAS